MKTMPDFAVIGNPIEHSLSPRIHHLFAQQTGKILSYRKITGHASCVEQQVHDFFSAGGKGLNITAPFKEKAFAMADNATKRCIQAKAANTLWLEHGKLWADNTDGVGFLRDLGHYFNLDKQRVLLIGAGGAARGIIGPLLACTIQTLTLVNRTFAKAQQLQQEYPQAHCVSLPDLQGEFHLIINATSARHEKSFFLSEQLFQSKPHCYDLSYDLTQEHPFITWASQYACKTQDGLGMLVEQAAEAFFIWHGVMPNARSVLTALR